MVRTLEFYEACKNYNMNMMTFLTKYHKKEIHILSKVKNEYSLIELVLINGIVEVAEFVINNYSDQLIGKKFSSKISDIAENDYLEMVIYVTTKLKPYCDIATLIPKMLYQACFNNNINIVNFVTENYNDYKKNISEFLKNNINRLFTQLCCNNFVLQIEYLIDNYHETLSNLNYREALLDVCKINNASLTKKFIPLIPDSETFILKFMNKDRIRSFCHYQLDNIIIYFCENYKDIKTIVLDDDVMRSSLKFRTFNVSEYILNNHNLDKSCVNDTIKIILRAYDDDKAKKIFDTMVVKYGKVINYATIYYSCEDNIWKYGDYKLINFFLDMDNIKFNPYATYYINNGGYEDDHYTRHSIYLTNMEILLRYFGGDIVYEFENQWVINISKLRDFHEKYKNINSYDLVDSTFHKNHVTYFNSEDFPEIFVLSRVPDTFYKVYCEKMNNLNRKKSARSVSETTPLKKQKIEK